MLILAINHNTPVLSPAEVFYERNVNSLYPIYGRQIPSHFWEGKRVEKPSGAGAPKAPSDEGAVAEGD